MLHAKLLLVYTKCFMLIFSLLSRGEHMAKLSMNAASKIFSVSRPTLLKHLQIGKVSGDKDAQTGQWTLDRSELARVYPLRAKLSDPLHGNFADISSDLDSGLHAKIEWLERQLAVAEARAEERQQRIEAQEKRLVEALKLLEGPQKSSHRRKWWPW